MYEEYVQSIEWWVPGLRVLDGGLMIVWLLAMLVVIGRGLFGLWKLRRAKDERRIGPQEYRWRSDERFRFYGWTTVWGCLMVPGLVFSILFVVVFAGAMFYSQNTGWNLAAIVSVIFWIGCFTWLVRRLRRDRREPSEPPFQEDPPELPFFFRTPQDHSKPRSG